MPLSCILTKFYKIQLGKTSKDRLDVSTLVNNHVLQLQHASSMTSLVALRDLPLNVDFCSCSCHTEVLGAP